MDKYIKAFQSGTGKKKKYNFSDKEIADWKNYYNNIHLGEPHVTTDDPRDRERAVFNSALVDYLRDKGHDFTVGHNLKLVNHSGDIESLDGDNYISSSNVTKLLNKLFSKAPGVLTNDFGYKDEDGGALNVRDFMTYYQKRSDKYKKNKYISYDPYTNQIYDNNITEGYIKAKAKNKNLSFNEYAKKIPSVRHLYAKKYLAHKSNEKDWTDSFDAGVVADLVDVASLGIGMSGLPVAAGVTSAISTGVHLYDDWDMPSGVKWGNFAENTGYTALAFLPFGGVAKGVTKGAAKTSKILNYGSRVAKKFPSWGGKLFRGAQGFDLWSNGANYINAGRDMFDSDLPVDERVHALRTVASGIQSASILTGAYRPAKYRSNPFKKKRLIIDNNIKALPSHYGPFPKLSNMEMPKGRKMVGSFKEKTPINKKLSSIKSVKEAGKVVKGKAKSAGKTIKSWSDRPYTVTSLANIYREGERLPVNQNVQDVINEKQSNMSIDDVNNEDMRTILSGDRENIINKVFTYTDKEGKLYVAVPDRSQGDNVTHIYRHEIDKNNALDKDILEQINYIDVIKVNQTGNPVYYRNDNEMNFYNWMDNLNKEGDIEYRKEVKKKEVTEQPGETTPPKKLFATDRDNSMTKEILLHLGTNAISRTFLDNSDKVLKIGKDLHDKDYSVAPMRVEHITPFIRGVEGMSFEQKANLEKSYNENSSKIETGDIQLNTLGNKFAEVKRNDYLANVNLKDLEYMLKDRSRFDQAMSKEFADTEKTINTNSKLLYDSKVANAQMEAANDTKYGQLQTDLLREEQLNNRSELKSISDIVHSYMNPYLYGDTSQDKYNKAYSKLSEVDKQKAYTYKQNARNATTREEQQAWMSEMNKILGLG